MGVGSESVVLALGDGTVKRRACRFHVTSSQQGASLVVVGHGRGLDIFGGFPKQHRRSLSLIRAKSLCAFHELALAVGLGHGIG